MVAKGDTDDNENYEEVPEVQTDFSEKKIEKAGMTARTQVLLRRNRILARPAQDEQQLRKMQPVQFDQAINSNDDMSERNKGCITWEREFEIRPRGGADSTETLFALVTCKFTGSCRLDGKHTIGLYSPRENCGYILPPIPGLSTGIPLRCQCVSLDGKLYILGGDSSNSELTGSDQVYVIDLRGENLVRGESLRWKQCASMLHPRVKFGVGVIGHEKIYVFGGISTNNCIRECEVYDPKDGADGAWSPIKPMPSPRHSHSVIAVGKELYVHGGEVLDLYDLDAEDGPTDPQNSSDKEAEDGLTDPAGRNDDEAEDGVIHLHGSNDEEVIDPLGSSDDEADSGEEPDPTLLEAYDPVDDKWRVDAGWMRKSSDAVFVVEEKVYVLDEWSISRLETPYWVHFTNCPIVASGYTFGPDLSAVVHPFATEALDGTRERGLVALVAWYNTSTGQNGKAIVRSEEFSEGSEVQWERVAKYSQHGPLSADVVSKPFFCRIDL